MKERKIASSVLVAILCFGLVSCTTDQILADINLLIQIAAEIATAVGSVSPNDGAIINNLSSVASKGMSVVLAAYQEYKKSGATTDLDKVKAAIQSAKDQLAAALAAAHITNPAKVTQINNWANLIIGTLNVILAALPQFQANRKLPKGVIVPTPASIKLQWRMSVCNNDPTCTALVK